MYPGVIKMKAVIVGDQSIQCYGAMMTDPLSNTEAIRETPLKC
jgi:hypothetical protein